MRTEQEVWERYYRHLNIQGTDWDINDPIIVADLEWVLYIGRDSTITPPENEFEETMNKGRALLKAIELAEKGLVQ